MSGTQAAACFDLSRNAEFGFIDGTPDPAVNGWRRVITGPEHPYIAAAQSMPFPGMGHGGQEFFTYQARAFLDEIAGLDRLPSPGHLRRRPAQPAGPAGGHRVRRHRRRRDGSAP